LVNSYTICFNVEINEFKRGSILDVGSAKFKEENYTLFIKLEKFVLTILWFDYIYINFIILKKFQTSQYNCK